MSYRAVREIEVRGRATIFGDVHGKLSALERILRARNVEAELDAGTHDVIFLGDLVDRGPVQFSGERMVNTGVEAVMDRVMALRRRHPERIHCVAGNHELMHARDIKRRALRSGDTSQWKSQGTLSLDDERIEFLTSLPLALVVRAGAQRAVIVHGGPPEEASSIDAMRDAPDLLEAHDCNFGGKCMLWSNPAWTKGSHHMAYAYTREHVEEFLEKLDADYLIRGHRDEPEDLPLSDGRRFLCVHTAQGDRHSDDPRAGSTHVEWDQPAPPELVRLKGE